MAFPSVVGTPGLTNLTSANPGTVQMPASIVAGELLIAVCSGDTSGSMSQSGGSDWTIISGPTNNGTVVCQTIFAKIAAGSDSLSVSFEANDFSAVCFRVQNHGVTNVATQITKGTAATGSDATPNPPNCNPGTAKDYLWIEAFSADDDDDTTNYETSSWTKVGQQQSANSTSSCLTAVASLQSNAASLDPGNMAMADIEEWITQTLAIPPANITPVAGTFSGVGTAALTMVATFAIGRTFSGVGTSALSRLISLFKGISGTSSPSLLRQISLNKSISATGTVDEEHGLVFTEIHNFSATGTVEKLLASLYSIVVSISAVGLAAFSKVFIPATPSSGPKVYRRLVSVIQYLLHGRRN